MTISTKEPARWPVIIPAQLAGLLQRSMPRWLSTDKLAEIQKVAPRTDADESTGGRCLEKLPWWAVHHPALSFRGTRRRS